MNTNMIQTDSEDLRFKALDILEKSNRIVDQLSRTDVCVTDQVISEHVKEIKELIDRITEYNTAHADSLWDILLFELEKCKGDLKNKPVHTFNTVQGISSNLPLLPPSPQDELEDYRPDLTQIYDYTEDAEPCEPSEAPLLPMPSPIAKTLERC